MNYRQTGNRGDTLVQLPLVKSFDLDPTPDKALQGRLDRVLRSVGASGFISVRARMITAISNTKFTTVDGDPVSLVGLHGKDELLVRGPVWAIELLGQGHVPDITQCSSWLHAMSKEVRSERERLNAASKVLAFYEENSSKLAALKGRSEFQQRRDSWGESKPAYILDRQTSAEDRKRLDQEFALLQGLQSVILDCEKWLEYFFGVRATDIVCHFQKADADDFFKSAAAQLDGVISRIGVHYQKVQNGELPWWFSSSQAWDDLKESVLLLTDSDQHYSKYLDGGIGGKGSMSMRPMGLFRWMDLPEKLCSAASLSVGAAMT